MRLNNVDLMHVSGGLSVKMNWKLATGLGVGIFVAVVGFAIFVALASKKKDSKYGTI